MNRKTITVSIVAIILAIISGFAYLKASQDKLEVSYTIMPLHKSPYSSTIIPNKIGERDDPSISMYFFELKEKDITHIMVPTKHAKEMEVSFCRPNLIFHGKEKAFDNEFHFFVRKDNSWIFYSLAEDLSRKMSFD